MYRSATGTGKEPGKSVQAKYGLNKSILDQGWSEFRGQLEYKLSWRGATLIKVPARYTSQKCSRCGNVSRNNRKSQSLFACESCGLEINADLNTSINIHALGQRGINACGDEGLLSSVNQEPQGTGDILPASAMQPGTPPFREGRMSNAQLLCWCHEVL